MSLIKLALWSIIAVAHVSAQECDTLKGCYLRNLKTGKERMLKTTDSYNVNSSNNSEYTIRCDVENKGEINFIKFLYNNKEHDEYGTPRYMNGDTHEIDYYVPVQYLVESCGSTKTVTVHGHTWRKQCFAETFVLQTKCSDDDDIVETSKPTLAPAKSPTKAPVKPPTTAPVKAPTMAPIKPPTKAPVKPPTKAPVVKTPAPVAPTPAPKTPETPLPTSSPTSVETPVPTLLTLSPTVSTESPTTAILATSSPTEGPTPKMATPTLRPVASPVAEAPTSTDMDTDEPTVAPTSADLDTDEPTVAPSVNDDANAPTASPSTNDDDATEAPSSAALDAPTKSPTAQDDDVTLTSDMPSSVPSAMPPSAATTPLPTSSPVDPAVPATPTVAPLAPLLVPSVTAVAPPTSAPVLPPVSAPVNAPVRRATLAPQTAAPVTVPTKSPVLPPATPSTCQTGFRLVSGSCISRSCRSDYKCPTGMERIPNRSCYKSKRDCQCAKGFVKRLGGRCEKNCAKKFWQIFKQC